MSHPCLIIACLALLSSAFQVLNASAKNVLFIYVDDLRPELGAYGQSHVHSPNIDTLASEGMVFDRAYVQQAVCHPSRISTLTGVRPDTAGVTDLVTDFRDRLPNIQTLPQLFKDNGYNSVGYGKIYHSPSVNDAASWSEPGGGFAENYQDPLRAVSGSSNRPPFEEPTNNPSEDSYADAKIANAAIARLETLATEYSSNDKPFFMAVGFLKPHLPFVAPKAYWDLYDVNTVPIATGVDALPPTNGVSAYLSNGFSGELGSYPTGQPSIGSNPATNIIENYGTTRLYPEFYARQMYEGYLACVSFIDAQVGKLMDALEDPNDDGDNSDSLVDDTIIVLIGDHGFHLGRNGVWPKHTNFDVAIRSPMIVKNPGMSAAGETSESIVEFIDLYPTLAELAGLTAPDHLEGTSFAAILDDETASTKDYAVSQFPMFPGNANYMGYTIRSDRYRYNEWRREDSGLVAFRELYDHDTDPSENNNIAVDPSNAAIMANLESELALVVGASAGDMPAGTEVYEGFFYEAGILESNDIGGQGFQSGWFGWADLRNSNSGTQIVSDSWDLPSGYGWKPFGLVGANGTSGNQPTRALLQKNFIDLSENDSRYFSFLYRPEANTQTFRLWFYDEDATTKALQFESQNLNLRLGFTSTSATGYSFTAGEDYLIVGKITTVASGNDTLQVNVYHSSDTVPSAEPAFTYSRTATSSHKIDRLVFGVPFNGTTSNIRFDELRIDSTYEAVVGVGASAAVAPIIYDASISGTERTGQTLTANYTWFDQNVGDTESGTLFQWQRSNDNGVTWSDVASANASTERPGPLKAGNIMRVAVTPGSSSSPQFGSSALSSLTGTITDGAVSNGLTAYWPFDDQGDPTRDITANDYDANINTSNAAYVTGKYGSGLELSGSDTAQATDIPLSGNALTVSAWVKHNGAYNSGTWEMIVGKNWPGFAFGVNAKTNQFRFQIKLSNNTDFFSQFNDASTVIPADTWTHVCGVRDGSTITLYINGAVQPSSFTAGASTLNIADTADQVYLGSHNNAGGNYWRGAIDEVRIYERALSASEVSTLYSYNPHDTGDAVSDWKNLNFANLPEGANDPQAADSYDIEPDGLTNLLEYASGLDPQNTDTLIHEVASETVGADESMTFTYRRLKGTGTGSTESGYTVEGVTYTPLIINDLTASNWNTGNTWLEEVSIASYDATTETVKVRALTGTSTPSGPANEDGHFFKLAVSR